MKELFLYMYSISSTYYCTYVLYMALEYNYIVYARCVLKNELNCLTGTAVKITIEPTYIHQAVH